MRPGIRILSPPKFLAFPYPLMGYGENPRNRRARALNPRIALWFKLLTHRDFGYFLSRRDRQCKNR